MGSNGKETVTIEDRKTQLRFENKCCGRCGWQGIQPPHYRENAI